MNALRSIALASAVFLAVNLPANAERVPLGPDELKAESTHILTGTVKAVYSREAESTLYGKGTVVVQYLLEIEVDATEKGEGLKKGQLVYARQWRLKKRGTAGLVPGPSGHATIPAGGERVRAHLAHGPYGPTGQSDQGWAVVYGNGLEVLAQPKK